MINSVKKYIFIVTFVLSLAVSGFVYFFMLNSTKEVFIEHKIASSKLLSKEIFSSMYHLMSKGWNKTELNDFILDTKSRVNEANIDIFIYRSALVDEIFGKIENPVANIAIEKEFEKSNSTPIYKMVDDNIYSSYPIVAQEECKKCHTNVEVGDNLGSINMIQSISKITQKLQSDFFWYTVYLLPIPLILAFMASLLISSRIVTSINKYKNYISGITKIRDLESINKNEIKSGLIEIDSIYTQTNELIKKLKSISTDRDILEFELSLLEQFVITSEMVIDWKEHIKGLVIKINSLINIYILFTVFKTKDNNFEIEVFWLNTPSMRIKEIFEKIIFDEIKTNKKLDFFEYANIHINHNTADSKQCLPEFNIDDLRLQTKSLLLTTPQIGGIVGVGLNHARNDYSERAVIEGILSTLLNVVGSVKVMDKLVNDLEYYATRDPLTHLFTKRVFLDLLEIEHTRANINNQPFSLLFINFDNFKEINTKYGHDTGNLYLSGFGKVVKEHFRKEDIKARYGGDEFVILLPDVNSTHAYIMAKTLQDTLKALKVKSSNGVVVEGSISIGVATFKEHSSNANELLLIAQEMMNLAKQAGKGNIKRPSNEEVDKLFQEIDKKSILVKRALDLSQINSYYQPIRDVKTKEIVSNEILMRIELENQTISAHEFIDIAERLSLTQDMDYILMKKAFEKAKECEYDKEVFINISPKALIIGGFIDRVKKLTEEYGIKNSNVVFEINERETVKNLNLLEKFVQNLKLDGFMFAIDSFGSGFLSFHYMKRFPIDYVKIDGEFVQNILTNKVDHAFVLSIATISKELGIKTIAQYVESKEVLDELEKMGIDFAQGFYIGKPSPKLF